MQHLLSSFICYGVTIPGTLLDRVVSIGESPTKQAFNSQYISETSVPNNDGLIGYKSKRRQIQNGDKSKTATRQNGVLTCRRFGYNQNGDKSKTATRQNGDKFKTTKYQNGECHRFDVFLICRRFGYNQNGDTSKR